MTKVLTKQSIDIEAPINQVFEFISNMENFQRWFPEVTKIISNNELHHGSVGKTYLEHVILPPNGLQKLKIEVKKVEIPTLFVTESEYSPLLPRMTIKLNSIDNKNTYLEWMMESRNTEEYFIKNLLPNFKMLINDRAISGLKNLKNLFKEVKSTH
ncbi:SRPBCC family protein [Tenacibaculum xiamenense]|uniref:SRPBCC family protein n=1 Tax=Tenacibaculum xiamenense TaxID=1261553 RepID=UPI003893FA33